MLSDLHFFTYYVVYIAFPLVALGDVNLPFYSPEPEGRVKGVNMATLNCFQEQMSHMIHHMPI